MIKNQNDNYFRFDGEEEEERGPALEIYGTDLTMLARQGLLEECFGREAELLEMMEILVRRQKNNPVLVGDAGVGKTAIIELFATKIVCNLVPFVLEGRTIVSLDLARIVAGSRYRGEFELRFQRVLDEVLDQPHIMIFIDEIHNLGGTGSAEGSLDAANILKPVLSRSGFQCIGATTTKEYELIERDPALNRRFQPIRVKQPTVDQTVEILYSLRPALEGFHNVEILPGAIRLAVELADRYIYDRFLPDKAIDLIDRAAAKEVIRLTNVTEGSVISGIVNASLVNIGKLRVEAFRRADIATEFIFQEIENAYRNFLLRWIDDPLTVPEEPIEFLSPITDELFDTMRLSILTRMQQLLFASPNPRFMNEQKPKICDLSIEKNIEVEKSFLANVLDKNDSENINVYRICLHLYEEWQPRLTTSKDLKKIIMSEILEDLEKTETINYIEAIYTETEHNSTVYSREDDFLSNDIEIEERTFPILSELETSRIEVFKEYLLDIQPVLRRGVVESLIYSSELDLDDFELCTIYNLLGYMSTDSGKMFLSNLEDPALLKRARRLGDFTGLKKRITQSDIQELMSSMTGIPIQSLSNEESQKLAKLEDTLHKRVIGQEEAVSAIAKAIRRSRLGLQNPNRPIASFLFCGPTGVGKTEVTKSLASTMFGSEDDMIRFDMSEFMEKFTISRLIGSPPGYVGYEEGGQLTDAVRRKPYSVVFFDEVEKAHPDILNILLQVLEDGRLTDTQKRLIPFDNTIIIMTSNAGSEEIQELLKHDIDSKSNTEKNNETDEVLEEDEILEVIEKRTRDKEFKSAIQFLESPIQINYLEDLKEQLRLEFEKSFRNVKDYKFLEKEFRKSNNLPVQKENDTEIVKNLKDVVLKKLSNLFLPEFLNRLDDIIIFKPLRPEELRKICEIMINEISKRVISKKINLIVDENVKLKLSRDGYNPAFGARPLRRLITKNVEDLISEYLLEQMSNPNTATNNKTRDLRISLDENDKIIINNIQRKF